MRKLLLLALMCSLCIHAISQTVYTNYWDGKIYFKIKNDSHVNLPDYNGTGSYDADFTAMISNYGITKIFKPFAKISTIELTRTYQINFTVIDSVNVLMGKLNAFSYIEYSEKVPIENIFLSTNDPLYSNQWGMTQVNANNAWNIWPNLTTYTNNIVKIAIVDNEILTTHPDLSGVLWNNVLEIAGNGIDDDGNGYIDDKNGFDVADNDPNTIGPSGFNHGTHCAGIACAQGNNSAGIAGMSYNVRLMPVKVTTNSALPSGSVVTAGWAGVTYAIVNKADVISLSWGGPGFAITYQNIINAANAQGIVVVAAAGNASLNLNVPGNEIYPAMYNNVITVGSTGTNVNNDAISYFSNYGTAIDIMAPGWNIYSTYSNGSYGYMDGTSMSAPLVAGLCGLMKSYNQYSSPSSIATCIYNNADNINSINPLFIGQLGNGRLNAFNAMQCMQVAPIVSFTSNTTLVCAGGSVQFTNSSGGAPPTNVSWICPGGTPFTPSGSNVTVTYSTPGVYACTLQVTNPYGTVQGSIVNYITVTACNSIVSENGNWYFGDKYAIGFSSGIGTGLLSTGTTINTNEAAACISDPSTGNLLFYTDGRKVYRSNHTIMMGLGGALNGSTNGTPASSHEGAMIIKDPNPANPTRYYVFTTSDDGPINVGLQYTIIDMAAAPGGDIVQINTPVQTPYNPKTTEHLNAIPHCNGTDYWIIVHSAELSSPDKILAYLLSASGVSATPVISMSYPNPSPGNIGSLIGSSASSPDGRKIAFGNVYSNLMYLYNFDKSSGVLTAASTISTSAYEVSFSPNSNILYVPTSSTEITQYDVTNLASPTILYTTTLPHEYRRFQLGPDNRLYITNMINQDVSIINNPDNINSVSTPNAFGFNDGVIDIPNIPVLTNTSYCLPNDIDSKKSIATAPTFTYTIVNCTKITFNTPTCAGSYSWNFGDGSSTITGSGAIPGGTHSGKTTGTYVNPSHVYSAGGTFTVTLTIGGNSTTQQVTILPTTLSISGPNPVCANALTPSAYSTGSYPGYGYNWNVNSGTVLTGVGTNSVNVNWTGSGLNSINVNVYQGGCTQMGVLFVNINPAPNVNAGSDVTSCSSSSAVIGGSPTASGSTSPYTYAWTPATNLTCTNCANPTASPTTPATYTVTVTDANGCVNSDNVVVNFITACNPPGATLLSGTIAAGPYSGLFKVNSNITISGSVSFSNAEISLYAGVKIIVPNLCTLSIDNSYLHACGCMWDGIEVQNGGTLLINQANPSLNRSAITDAVKAINTVSSATTTPIPRFRIEGTIFNVNETSIKVTSHPGNLSACYIRNNIITSRQLPITLGTLASLFTTLQTDYTNNVSVFPSKSIITGNRSKRGVDLDGLSNATPIKIGDQASAGYQNVFDNLDYAIYSNNSTVNIYNNKFTFLTARADGIPFLGIGVFSPTTNTTAGTIVIGGMGANEGNIFHNCYRATEINKNRTVRVINNKLRCTTTAVATANGTIGDFGIYLRDVNFEITVTDNSQIENYSNGVYIIRNTTLGSINPSVISVERNSIIGSGTGFVANGIRLSDVSTNTITTNNNITLGNNTLSNVRRGVWVSNIKNRARVYDNTIDVQYISGTTVRDGIKLEGSDKAEIKNNEISTTYVGPTNTSLRGIYVIQSINNKVYCNTITQVGEGMAFEGTCNSAYISPAYDKGVRSNTMIGCNRGFVLRTNGKVDTQGDGTHPAGFAWSGSFPGGYTYIFNTTNVLNDSKIYGLSGTIPGDIPSSNHQSNNLPDRYQFVNGGLNTSTSGTPLSCPTTFLLPPISNDLRSNAASFDEQLEDVIQNNIIYPVFNTETQWQQQWYVYREIKSNPNLLLNPTLNAFYISNQNSGFEKLWNVTALTENGDFLLANSVNNSIQPICLPETNHKLFNTINLQQHIYGNYNFTVAEINDLNEIAHQCPLKGGDAVYQARNLLMYIENKSIDFEDNCIDTQKDGEMKVSDSTHVVPSMVKLYPNPNNGQMTVEYSLSYDGEFIIRDIVGHEICHYKLPVSTQKKEIDCNQLSNGSYIYEVYSKGRLIKIDKFIINK